jgi:hydrogenase-4 component B
MLNHSLFKLLLFLAAGIVYINRHELNLNKIRGFGRGKPLFLFVFLMAALGICGIPLWSGYVSKTLLHKSLADGVYYFQGLALEAPLRFS